MKKSEKQGEIEGKDSCLARRAKRLHHDVRRKPETQNVAFDSLSRDSTLGLCLPYKVVVVIGAIQMHTHTRIPDDYIHSPK